MGKYVFQLIKLIVSMVLQCGIIFSCPIFYSGGLSILGLLEMFLGEAGIYLLYSLKPLENRRKNIVYTVVYASVHVVLFSVCIYINLTQPFPSMN